MEGKNGTQAITPFQPQNLEQAMALAKTLASSGLIPGYLRQKPADVLVILIAGHELGLSPMQAMRGLYVIDGKVAQYADLTVALVVKHREICEFFRLVESTDAKATYQTKRAGGEPQTISYTIQQAQQAQLAGKGTWAKHPAAMLRARAAMALARAVYPDLTLGVYDPDEVQEFAPTFSAPPSPAAALPEQSSPQEEPAAGQEVEVQPENESQDPASDPVLAAIEAATTKPALYAAMKHLSPDARKPYLAAYEAKAKALSGRA